MTLILSQLNKNSRFNPTTDPMKLIEDMDKDLVRLFNALRPSLVFDVTYASSITLDASRSFHFRITLAGNPTIENFTNGRDGQDVLVQLLQDSTGSRTVTWGSKFVFSDDIPQPTLSTTAGDTDLILFLYDAPEDKLMCIGVSRGYTL